MRDHQHPCQALMKLHIKVSLKTTLSARDGVGRLRSEVFCTTSGISSPCYLLKQTVHVYPADYERFRHQQKETTPLFCSATTTRGNYLESVACVVIQQNTALDVRAFKCPGFWAPVCCGMIRNQVGGKGQQRKNACMRERAE